MKYFILIICFLLYTSKINGQLIQNNNININNVLTDKLVPLTEFLIDTILKLLTNQKNDFLNSIDNTNSKLNEIKILYAKIKQNPIRFIDLLIYLSDNNVRIISQAFNINTFKDYDQWIDFFFKLIIDRIKFWDNSLNSQTVTDYSINLTTNNPLNPTNPSKPDTNEYFIEDPSFCKSKKIDDCILDVSQPQINIIHYLCKSLCTCRVNLFCNNNGTPLLTTFGNCKCLCNANYTGEKCENKMISQREFCFESMKQYCQTSNNFRLYCPELCKS